MTAIATNSPESISTPPSDSSTTPMSYAGRTARIVSQGSRSAYRKSGLSGLFHDDSSRSTDGRPSGTRSTLDTARVLYPTLQTHPEPAPHPIIVLSLAEIDHITPLITNDELYDELLRRLEPWAGEEGKGGYVLVILAGGDQATKTGRKWPSTAWWIWKLKRMPRKYRKNLKRLYTVHPSTFVRTLVPFLIPFISPKTHSKLFPVSSLTALYRRRQVTLSGIDISLAVFHEEAAALEKDTDLLPSEPDLYRSPSEASDAQSWTGTISSTFSFAASYLPFIGRKAYDDPTLPGEGEGLWKRDIGNLLGSNGGRIPLAMVHLRSAILTHCVGTEGVFRRSTSSTLLSPITALLDLPIDCQPNLPWNAIAQEDPLLPPKVLLRWLGSFSEPVIPVDLYETIRQVTSWTELQTIFLPLLDPLNRLVLDFVVELLREVAAHESSTKMSPLSLSIVVAPTLIKGPDPLKDAQMCMPPGKTLPAGLALLGETKSGADPLQHRTGTLVGLLDIWIRCGQTSDDEKA